MLFRKKKRSEMKKVLNILKRQQKAELRLEKLFRAKAKETSDSDLLILSNMHQHTRFVLEEIEAIILNGET